MNEHSGASSSDPLVIEAVNFFSSHLSDKVTLPRLVRQLGTNTATLSRRFRASTGLSPHAVLKLIRLRRAAELLVTTNGKVKEIASAVGYRDVSDFVRAFARSFGVAPTAYREAGVFWSCCRQK